MKELENITQSTKIAQQVVKEAVKNGDSNITVNIIGKIEIARNAQEQQEVGTQQNLITEGKGSTFKKFYVNDSDIGKVGENVYLAMKLILDEMPHPKFDGVIKLMFSVGNERCANFSDLGQYLGVPHHRARDLSKKFGIIKGE